MKTRSAPRRTNFSLYRAIWLWHFYAGLLVLPFMILLAVTGGIYLFQDEFDAYYYSDWNRVAVPDTPRLPVSELLAGAGAQMPGEVRRFTLPATPEGAVTLFSTLDPRNRFDGYTGYVNPYTGELLGVTSGGVMELVRNLHSLNYFGFWANCVMEIVAGWAIILVATGLCLWWPRKRRGEALTVRGPPAKRSFWRDSHATIGLFAGGLIAFLALSGMPWSPVWGQGVHRLVAATGSGRPAAPGSGQSHAEHLGKSDWTLDPMPVPMSHHGKHPIGIDKALARFRELGFSGEYRVALPQGPMGAYSAASGAERGDDIRIVHLDQYSGKLLAEYDYDDFGIGSKVIGWSVAVHLGDAYGWINQLVMLLACLAIVLMALSALVMWWKRRPQGKLGVPPLPLDRRATRSVLIAVALGGILFPLVGLSILLAFGIDWLLGRVARLYRRATIAETGSA